MRNWVHVVPIFSTDPSTYISIKNYFQTHTHENMATKYHPQYAAKGYSHNKHIFMV